MLTQSTRNAFATLSKRPYICQSCLRRARKVQCATTTSITLTSNRALQTDSQASPPKDDVPFRKLLKDAAKQKKKQNRGASRPSPEHPINKDAKLENWELTVGIEIHAELNTARKLFSSAATSVNEEPNTHVALFDVAFPGSQPHFQQETLIPALRAALALNCQIQPRSSFDRKHYFYQDQPAGYQITQYYGKSDSHVFVPV